MDEEGSGVSVFCSGSDSGPSAAEQCGVPLGSFERAACSGSEAGSSESGGEELMITVNKAGGGNADGRTT